VGVFLVHDPVKSIIASRKSVIIRTFIVPPWLPEKIA
jgi:hypothetical protein